MSRNLIITIIPENRIDATIISVMPLETLAKIFQRALNTWEAPPAYLLGLSDKLAELLEEQNAVALALASKPTESPSPAASN